MKLHPRDVKYLRALAEAFVLAPEDGKEYLRLDDALGEASERLGIDSQDWVDEAYRELGEA